MPERLHRLKDKKQKQRAEILKISRKVHRTTGALLFVFFFAVSVTGLLLGWKKNSGGVLLAKTYAGKSTDQKNWMPMHLLQERALQYAREHISDDYQAKVDRIDVRPDKGIVKFVFVEDYWGLQIDATTGELLHVERRTADLIENIHDGSVLDYLAGTDGIFKLIYTSIMGLALTLFTITGFWLWYGPKNFKKHRDAGLGADV